jgi:4-hydroxyphenylpyruvate dioxygenase
MPDQTSTRWGPAVQFVEFTAPTNRPAGSSLARRRCHAPVQAVLVPPGRINFILNGEGGFPKDFRDQHGPSVCAIAIRVDDAPKAMARAQELGAKALINEPGPMELALPGIEAIGGSRIFFIDRYDDTGSIYDVDFKPIKGADQRPEGAGLVEIDHLTNNVYRGRMDHWAQFYETLFNFREIRYFDIEGKLTGLKSRAMTSPDGKIRIPINESSDDKSQIEEYLRVYKGEGIQHIAMSTTNIYETVRRLRANSVELMAPPPETYYEMLAERLPGHGEDVAKLKELGILLDGSPTHDGKGGGLLLQIFTQTMVGPIFFEIIQRKCDEGSVKAISALFLNRSSATR